MSETKIRAANEADWRTIRALHEEIFIFEKQHFEPTWNVKYPFSTKAKKYFLDACKHENNHAAFVYDKDTEILGYGIILHHPSEEQQHREGVILYQIDTISVTHEHRNKGIGRKLMDHMIAYAKENGGTHISIGVFSKNSRAKHLYESSGFSESMIFLEQSLKNKP